MKGNVVVWAYNDHFKAVLLNLGYAYPRGYVKSKKKIQNKLSHHINRSEPH
jgi:hypothetical protein